MTTVSNLQIRKLLRHSLRILAAIVVFTLFRGGPSARAQKYDPTPADIVSWWSAENSALDNLGINNGTYVGTPSHAPGEVGYAFNFDGATQFVRVPDSASLHFSNAMTLEAWIYLSSYNTSSDSMVLGKYAAPEGSPPGQSSWALYVNGDGRGGILATTDGGNSSVNVYSTNICPLNAWTHLAASYDGTNLEIYLNGALQGSAPMPGELFPGTYDLGIGANAGGVPNSGAVSLFDGMIDEVSVYSRALSANEIQAIYHAGSAGKCPLPLAITVQPANTSVFATQQAAFSVGAVGAGPLTYQWYFRGSKISGSTASSLLLTNLQTRQAGTYRVKVTDAARHHVNSHSATLTVLPAPRCFPAPSNLVSWWRGESNALDCVGGNNGVLVNSSFGHRQKRWPVQGNVFEDARTENGSHPNSIPFAPGKVGTAFNFNGYSQFVRVPDQPNLHLTDAMTVEAWVCPTAYNPQTDSSIMCKYDARSSPGGQASWALFINGDGRGAVLVSMNGENGINLYSTSLCPLNAWTHLAATYDGANLKIFFNGVQQDSVPMTGNIFPGTDDVGIGANVGGVGNGQAAALFAGMIDEPSIYSRALSSAEILGIYNAGVSGKCPIRPSSSPGR